MEKKKPTIDEIYKLNVDGLFESTANWFDNAFKKSQAEINRDLYNKINGYSSSSESTGGTVNLGPLLNSLNGSNLYPSRGYLYYNGNDWEFNTPTVSGGGGGVVDTASITKIVNDTIKNVSWWGQKINNNKVDGNIVITKGSHSFTIELDDNGNLKFNGNIYATGGVTALGVGTTTGGGSGVSLGTLLAQLNNENPFPTANGQVLTYDGTNFVWKTPTSGSGSSSRIKNIKLFTNNSDYSFETIELGTADTIGFMQGDNITFQAVVKEFTNVIKISATGGSGGTGGSSGTTAGKLYFYKNGSEEYWNGESNFKIIFGSGLNVTWDSHSQITLSATGGGSGGSTSTSVSWQDVTNKPSTFTPSSHTHSAASITDFASTVKGIKVNDASHADAANKLASSVYLWGNSFNGIRNIGSSTNNKADLRYVNNIYTGDTFGLYNTVNGIDTSLLSIDNTPNISVAYGYRSNENAILSLFGNKTKIYTNGQNYHFDFVRNVFDVNSNQIHFGSETNGGKISWDAANNAFKIEGNVYATGGITALGVSNNATTSNNVDFTFRSVTINGARQNKVQLTDDGLVFYNQNNINAYYKKDSIGLYDSANDTCCKIFGFNDSEFVFDPDRYSVVIKFNTAIECSTDENSLIVGNNSTNGYIVFSAGSTMTFNHNNKNYSFNVDKAIEQGILTI